MRCEMITTLMTVGQLAAGTAGICYEGLELLGLRTSQLLRPESPKVEVAV